MIHNINVQKQFIIENERQEMEEKAREEKRELEKSRKEEALASAMAARNALNIS